MTDEQKISRAEHMDLMRQCEVMRAALQLARPIVEADWHAGMEAKDADWEGQAWTALKAIDAALSNAGFDAAVREGFNA